MPYGASHGASGVPARVRGAVPLEPSLRGRPASVISATLQRPAAIASRACATSEMYDVPPRSVLSVWRTVRFR